MHPARWLIAAGLLLLLPVVHGGCDGGPGPADQAGGLVLIALGDLHRADIGGALVSCLSAAERIRLDVEVNGVPVRLFRQITPGATVDTMTARGVEGEATLTIEVLSTNEAVLFRGRQTFDIDPEFSPLRFDSVEQVNPVLKVCYPSLRFSEGDASPLDLTAGDSTFWVVNQDTADRSLAWTFDLLEEPCGNDPCVRARIDGREIHPDTTWTTAPGSAPSVRVSPTPHHAMRLTAEVRSEEVGRVRFEIRTGSTDPEDPPMPPLAAVDDTFRVAWRAETAPGELAPVASALDVLANDTLTGDALLRVAGPPAFAASPPTLSADARRILYMPRRDTDRDLGCAAPVIHDALSYTLLQGERADTADVYLSLIVDARDDRETVLAGETAAVEVLVNDDFAARSCLTYGIAEPPRNGEAEADGDLLRYTPGAGFSGRDSLRYWIREGGEHDTAAVFLDVTPVTPPAPPTAADDVAQTFAGQSATIPVLDNDAPGHPLPVRIADLGQPAAGAAEIAGQRVRYTPNDDFAGTDRFSYTVTDGTQTSLPAEVLVFIVPLARDDAASTFRDIPVTIAILDNDTPDAPAHVVPEIRVPPTGGAVEIVRDSLSYTPDADFLGQDRVDYVLTAGDATSAPATVRIDVAPRTYAWVRIPEDAPASLAEICTDLVAPGDVALLENIRAIVEQTAASTDDEWLEITDRPSASYVVPFDLIEAQAERLACACPRPASACPDGAEGEEAPFCRTEPADAGLTFFQGLDEALRTPPPGWRFEREHLYPYPECFDIDRVRLKQE